MLDLGDFEAQIFLQLSSLQDGICVKVLDPEFEVFIGLFGVFERVDGQFDLVHRSESAQQDGSLND